MRARWVSERQALAKPLQFLKIRVAKRDRDKDIPIPPTIWRPVQEIADCLDRIATRQDDPILRLRGLEKEIRADTDADEYVRCLRANWYGDRPDPTDTAEVNG
jgi:hypothetical protein